jgi:predicted metalloprotease with PDZ domain
VAPSPSPSPRSSRAPGAARAPIVGDYTASWDDATGSVAVEARFTASAGGAFAVERGAEAFLRDVEAAPDRDGAPWTPTTRSGRQLEAAPCAAGACRLRYRMALRSAAKKIDDVDVASEEGEVVEAPPSTWLLTPSRAARELRLRFRVACAEGSRFVTGVLRSEEAPGSWDISIDDMWTSPYTAFGPLRVRTIAVKGGTIDLAIGPGTTAVTEDELAHWVESSAHAVTAYYGRFPMPNALVLLVVSRGRWVGSGRTLSGGGGTVFVRIGEHALSKAYRDDWVLVHEMIHLTFPSVIREQDWAEEGIATYAEPFARVRAGLLSEEDAWLGLADGLPNGLPATGDRGLDKTHTWGRIYWGGALFWFLADVEIRKRTQNRFGLDHALRGILDAGGSNATRWPLTQALDAGDRAIGMPVLRELYAAMSNAAHPVDLDGLLVSLGIKLSGGHVTLDDHAPLAEIRRAIARGSHEADAGQ